jgi:hypothetical protein
MSSNESVEERGQAGFVQVNRVSDFVVENGIWTWSYNRGPDGPFLGGSQVSNARPGAPFFYLLQLPVFLGS